MDLNKAMIIGRLTRDPEARTTPGGQSVCSFSLATNFVWSDQQGQKQERVEWVESQVALERYRNYGP